MPRDREFPRYRNWQIIAPQVFARAHSIIARPEIFVFTSEKYARDVGYADARVYERDSVGILSVLRLSGQVSWKEAFYLAECTDTEYDCEDTCIAAELKCNGRDNCRYHFDEDDSTCGVSDYITATALTLLTFRISRASPFPLHFPDISAVRAVSAAAEIHREVGCKQFHSIAYQTCRDSYCATSLKFTQLDWHFRESWVNTFS